MSEGTGATPPIVLVVEDSSSVARMLRFSLRRAGFDVIEAATGQGALAVMRERIPDAVVLDLGLPDGQGATVLERLRRSEWENEPSPAWIAVSALSWHEAIRQYGCMTNHFLAKPFDPWELIRMLKELLAQRGRPWPQEVAQEEKGGSICSG